MNVRFLVHVVLFACCSGMSQAEVILPAVDCVIIPSKTVDISAAVPGVIGRLHLERSDSVNKGMLLAELDSRVEQANVELSRVRSEMRAEVSAEQVNLKYDQLQSRRVRDLKQKNLISDQNKDEAARLEEVTYWRLKQAKDTFKTRQLELYRAIAQLEETKVYSTIDGVVAEVYKTEGEYVEDQPIMRLVQLNPLHVEAVFPMEHYGLIKKNMLAGVYPEIDPNHELHAKVLIIDPVGDTASGTFGVRLIMDNPDNKIPAGMKCVLKLDPSTGEPFVETNVNKTAVLSKSPDTASNQTPDKLATEVLLATKKPEIMPIKSEPPTQVKRLNTYSLGPFDSELKALSAEESLRQHGYEFSRRDENLSEIKGYLVLLTESYQQSQRHLIDEFHQKGVTGMMILPQRSYNGRLSFGAYNGVEMANIRQQNLAQKGIRSEVIARHAGETQIWLDVAEIEDSNATSILDSISASYH